MRLLTIGLAALAVHAAVLAGPALAASCTGEDIANAVDQVGAKLRAFNSDTMAALAPKLKQLQTARGWSNEELAAKTDALVSDAEVTAFDKQAYEQFTRIDELGASGSSASDCRRLDDIHVAAQGLIGTMQAKAAHMNAKVAEAMHAPRSEPAEPAVKPKANAEPGKAKPAILHDWTTKTAADPGYAAGQQAALEAFKLPPAVPMGTEGEATYSIEEIKATSSGLFGTLTSNLASVIAFAFEKAGKPNGYILGQEAGGAFLAGVRYGDGTLHLKDGSVTKVYWRGPSLGADLGASQGRTMFLVYHLKSKADVFKLVSGIDGSAFVIGGIGITFLSDGKTILAPIRTGPGLRLGVNAGYLKLTPERNWVPF
jgi:hypothetical protein